MNGQDTTKAASDTTKAGTWDDPRIAAADSALQKFEQDFGMSDSTAHTEHPIPNTGLHQHHPQVKGTMSQSTSDAIDKMTQKQFTGASSVTPDSPKP